VRVGYFGSYARNDWGVGSDLDIVIVLSTCDVPPNRRALTWDTTTLPVPADVLIYSADEWRELTGSNRRFGRMLATEVVWVYSRFGDPAS
jgi:predicted nucleotidyltransferase